MTEQWLSVVGWEGLYWVSDHGRVRSADRVTNGRRIKGRVLKPFPAPSGHLLVDLKDGERWDRSVRVHRLLLQAFVGPCPDGVEVLHWDDDPTNNHLSNLRYGTRTQNLLDMVRNGRHWQVKKTHCPNGHEYSPENTYLNMNRRNCRICSRKYKRDYEARRRSA